MKKGIRLIRNAGFTLIEVLVTVVVIGVLAAVVIPAVTAQVTAGDSTRVISDLNNIRTGIENFDIAVRQFPGDIDDLVNLPGTSVSSTGANVDADVTGALYVSPSSWSGPYLESALPLSVTSTTFPSASGAAFKTGYTGTINNQLLLCSIAAGTGCVTGTSYVTALVNGLTLSQAATLNDLIDGANETASATSGKFRVVSDAASSTGYYLATPFK